VCLTCKDEFEVSSDGYCDCILGILINGSCLLEGCLSYQDPPGPFTECLTCNNSLYYAFPVSNSCLCLPGGTVNGVCRAVFYGQDCIALGFDNCLKCLQAECLVCSSSFYQAGGMCVCIVGTAVNGICTEMIGCVDPVQLLDGSTTCLACN
jgi:hypothetical protein